MSAKSIRVVVSVCLLLTLCALAAQGAGRSITLTVNRNGVNNSGSDVIRFDWSISFDTTCSSISFQIIGPSPGNAVVINQSPACGSSPRSGFFEWTVPAGQATGLYTAKLVFNSHWNGDAFCCPADFQDLAQVQFKVCCAGRLRFCKYLDRTGNGVKDTGDTPLSGWRFSVQKQDGTEVASGTTDATGCTPEIIVPMSPCDATSTVYYVLETPPDGNTGWLRTSPSPGPASQRFTVTALCGQLVSTEVLNWCPGTLRLCKFLDVNGNGVKDNGEPPLPGWRFTIAGSTYTTGAGGCTQDILLASDTYQVTEAPPVGDTKPWLRTVPSPGAFGTPFNVTLQGCGVVTTVNVGNWCPGIVRFCKFLDLDGSGTRNAGDTPLAGWKFTINGNTYTTNADGCTDLITVPVDPNVGQQTYSVTEAPPAGDTRPWQRTVPSPGPASTPFDVIVQGCQSTAQTIDVGNWVPVTITGRKLMDVAPWPWTSPPYNNPPNPPGFEPVPDCTSKTIPLQTGTSGIPGVTISLRNAADTADILPPVLTDANGNFSFGPFHFGSIAPIDLLIKESNIPAIPPECNTNPDGLPVAVLPQPFPWPGAFASTVAQSIWPCPTNDFASPDTLDITLPVPTVAGQEYGYNYFYNRQPSRIWGQICPSTLTLQQGATPPLPNLQINAEKVVEATPSVWPAGAAQANTVTGIYAVSELPEEPLPENNVRAGYYRLTPPTPSDPTRYVWKVTTYCAEDVTIEDSGRVTFFVPPGTDVRVDFCLEEISERRCFMPVTLTQQGWHNFCDPNNPIIPGGMIYNKFRFAFANYTFYGTTYHGKVIIGKGDKTVTFESTTAALNRLCFFLPQTGTCGKLDTSYLNPTTTSAGVLAGETLALQMNIAYNDQRLMPRTAGYDLEKFRLAEGLFKGKTVGQVRDIANAVLAGAVPSSFGLPSPFAAGCAELVSILQKINANYEFVNFDVFNDRGYLIPNVPVGVGNLQPPSPVVVPTP